MSEPEDFAFCESVWAGPRSKWHIRKLTPEVGRKLGGGIDTPSLCGNVKQGWDLEVRLNLFHLRKVACKDCREALLSEIPMATFPPAAVPRNKRD